MVVLFAIPVIALLWMTSVPGSSFDEDLPELTVKEKVLSENLADHVAVLGAKPNNIQHFSELEKTATYIESHLSAIGYEVIKHPFSVGETEVRNIEVVVSPKNKDAPTLVIGGHYDSYGKAPGANDNGSGSAAVLELARLLQNLASKSELRIRLTLFVNEEPPYFKTEYMGSAVYANALAETDEELVGMFSLETMGYFSDRPSSQKFPFPLGAFYPSKGNFIAFVGDSSARSFVRSSVKEFRKSAKFPSEGGTAPAFIQGIDWSDHRSFSAIGVPALMITDTAAFRYPHYHSRRDTPDKVDTGKLARVVAGLEIVVRKWATEGYPD